jgi:hypothetical protein
MRDDPGNAVIIAGCIFLLGALGGAIAGGLAVDVRWRQNAQQAGHGRWVLADETTGRTQFIWVDGETARPKP